MAIARKAQHNHEDVQQKELDWLAGFATPGKNSDSFALENEEERIYFVCERSCSRNRWSCRGVRRGGGKGALGVPWIYGYKKLAISS
jgi:hypothetical protein